MKPEIKNIDKDKSIEKGTRLSFFMICVLLFFPRKYKMMP